MGMFVLVCVSVLYLMVGPGPVMGSDRPPKADLVIHNGTVYTLDKRNATAEALAIIDGRIAFVGSDDDAEGWIGHQTKQIDLQGKSMFPGFIEGHGHLLGLGYSRMRLDLSDVKNYEELVARVAAAVKGARPGEWIRGHGWHQSKWGRPPKPMVQGFQTHHALSRVSPDNPVYLTHASGHAALANAKAMEIAAITPSTPFTQDGEIIRDARGEPTGIFNEEARNLIRRHIPESTPAGNRRALEIAIQECLAHGITSFQDAGSGRKAIQLYREFLKQGNLKLRLWAMLSGDDETLLEEWYARGPEIGAGNRFLTIRAIKLFADGALGSRGAWLLAPYSDRPKHTGHATIPMDAVYKVARQALARGFQLCVHAIGDRANREVLNQFERALNASPHGAENHRFRIEHAQHLSQTDIPRFQKMGVIASMQGIHLASDRPWAVDRLGHKRIVEGAYAWQKLLQTGAVIVNGTDTPVEPIDPVACFYASVTRRTLKGQPPEGYEPEQKMTRYQALRSYTLDAAYGAFEEGLKGSIEVGKLADFTVLSQDIMQVPDDMILNARVLYTIVDGRIVYMRKDP